MIPARSSVESAVAAAAAVVVAAAAAAVVPFFGTIVPALIIVSLMSGEIPSTTMTWSKDLECPVSHLPWVVPSQ